MIIMKKAGTMMILLAISTKYVCMNVRTLEGAVK